MGTIGMILIAIGGIGCLVFWIQILILAFKTSTGWGLASLFLPLAIFFYIAKNWAACKTPFLRLLGCFVVYMVGFGLSTYGAISSGMVAPTQ